MFATAIFESGYNCLYQSNSLFCFTCCKISLKPVLNARNVLNAKYLGLLDEGLLQLQVIMTSIPILSSAVSSLIFPKYSSSQFVLCHSFSGCTASSAYTVVICGRELFQKSLCPCPLAMIHFQVLLFTSVSPFSQHF